MIATKTDGLVTYIGFDPANNGKRWIEEKGNYTYVKKQDDEWTVSYVPIAAYNSKYLEEAKKQRYVLPPYPIEKQIIDGKTAYHFWKGKDYWFMDKEEAIEFINKSWDEKEK